MERTAKDGTVYQSNDGKNWEIVTRSAKDGTEFKKVSGGLWEPVDPDVVYEPKKDDGPLFEPSDVGAAGLGTVGEIGGAAFGPYGSRAGGLIGAALGGAGGEVYEQVDRPDQSLDAYLGAAKKGAYEGFSGELTGLAAGKAFKLGGKAFKKLTGDSPYGLLKGAAKKGISSLSGVPQPAMEVYGSFVKNIDPYIEKIRSSKVGRGVSKTREVISKNNVTSVANELRDKIIKAKDDFRKAKNKVIGKYLKESGDTVIDTKQVESALEPIIGGLNEISPDIRPEEYNQLKYFIDRFLNVGGEDGSGYTVKRLTELQDDIANYAYKGKKPDHKAFGKDSGVQEFVKSLMRQTDYKLKEMIRSQLPNEFGEAYSKLYDLRLAEADTPINLLKKSSPATQLLSSGTGMNETAEIAIDQLDGVLGTNFLDELAYLETARQFADPELFSKFTTGRSGLGGAVGGAAGGAVFGIGAIPITALIGTMAGSPAGVKTLIKMGVMSEGIAKHAIKIGGPVTKRLASQWLSENYGAERAGRAVSDQVSLKRGMLGARPTTGTQGLLGEEPRQ